MGDKIDGKKKFGWSKYGGGNFGLYGGNLQEEWFCQACGEKQPNALPPYKAEIILRNYVRICSKCFNIKRVRKVGYYVLIRIVRKSSLIRQERLELLTSQ